MTTKPPRMPGASAPRVLAFSAAVLCSTLSALGCRSEHATATDCAYILDKIVDVELRERGFRDPALSRRKRDEVRRSLGAELLECEGKRL